MPFIRYPLAANTLAKRIRFAVAAQEKLRRWHNRIGKRFRDGKIDQARWNTFRNGRWERLNQRVGKEVARLRAKLPEPINPDKPRLDRVELRKRLRQADYDQVDTDNLAPEGETE